MRLITRLETPAEVTNYMYIVRNLWTLNHLVMAFIVHN